MSCWRWNGSLLIEAEIIFIEKGVTFRLVLGCPQTINNVNISYSQHHCGLSINIDDITNDDVSSIFIATNRIFSYVQYLLTISIDRPRISLYVQWYWEPWILIINIYIYIHIARLMASLLIIWQTNSKIGDVRFVSSQIAISATGPWTDRSNLLANKW